MSRSNRLQKWRSWFPVPVAGRGIKPVRWLLLEGNRHAVTAALLSMTFSAILAVGTVWTFEMQRLLTETAAVQTLLNTLLSGIILLVSIVVSINAIVLSYELTPIGSQEDRIQGAMEFRRDVGGLADTGPSPSDPRSFLELMSEVIRQRARRLEMETDGADRADGEFAREVQEYVDSVLATVDELDTTLDRAGWGDFGVLWVGLNVDYGTHMNHSRTISGTYTDRVTGDAEEQFEDLVRAFEKLATGKEYFKTLYYSQEVSQLSRTLLIISLPAILVTASTILAINAGLLPDVWMFGLPPLLTFVATTFTIALAPFLVLTAFMLRLATVANRTIAAGPFVLTS